MDMDKISQQSRAMFDRIVLNVTRSYDHSFEDLNGRDRVCFISNDSLDTTNFAFHLGFYVFLCNREKQKYEIVERGAGGRARGLGGEDHAYVGYT